MMRHIFDTATDFNKHLRRFIVLYLSLVHTPKISDQKLEHYFQLYCLVGSAINVRQRKDVVL